MELCKNIRWTLGDKWHVDKKFDCKFLTSHGQCMCKLVAQDKDCKTITHADGSKSTYGGTCDPAPDVSSGYSDLLVDPVTGEKFAAFAKGGF